MSRRREYRGSPDAGRPLESERFVDEAYLNDLWKPAEGRSVDSYKQIDWMNPARGHIHPVQEIAAFSQAIRDGITSRKRVAASHGEDIEDIDRENAEDQARAKRLGLMYPVYPGLEHDALLQQSMAEDAAANGTDQPDGSTPPVTGPSTLTTTVSPSEPAW